MDIGCPKNMDFEDYFVREGLLPPLKRWMRHPCEATAGVSGGEEALEVSVRNIKKQIKKAKRGMYTVLSLEQMEQQMQQFKQTTKEIKREDRRERKAFLKKQTKFCNELIAQGYPAEWVPDETTHPRMNPVLGLMFDTGVIQ
jgi:hypothetical protein